MKKLALVLILCSFNFKTGIPELNTKILEYLDTVMGKKVDRGECWDLAAGALAYSGAYFDRSSKRTINVYGRLVDPGREEIFPGDLIQFEKVKVQWTKRYTTFNESMEHHTAIVYEVNGPGDFQIAHQNTQHTGRKVGVSNFRLDRVIKGKVMIYRPISKKE
ncbi:MAG: hypothetical protein GY816_17515 [Cytophagales bacterium]|nr:hypothetical protein [Cytophagales bacterium]